MLLVWYQEIYWRLFFWAYESFSLYCNLYCKNTKYWSQTDGRQICVTIFEDELLPAMQGHGWQVLGFSPHSDGSFFTLLLEVNSVPALQIKRHNAWIPVKPNPKALLVNVGDYLEVWNLSCKLYMFVTDVFKHDLNTKRNHGQQCNHPKKI